MPTFRVRISGQTNSFVIEGDTQPECSEPYKTYELRLVGGATLSVQGRLVEDITPTKRQAPPPRNQNVDYGLERTLERLAEEQREHYEGRAPRLTRKRRDG